MSLNRRPRLLGRVTSAGPDAGGHGTTVLVMHGRSRVADGQVSEDGRFEIDLPPRADVVVTVIGQDGRAVRKRLAGPRGDRLDLGELELPAAEFPPGIAGQAWDAREDRPVTGGRATLRLGRREIASQRLDGNGGFSFELTARNPMPAAKHRVLIEAPGYRRATRVVEVSDEVTSYRIGRVELVATRKR